jgi:pre-mRNA-processing factor 17
MNLLADYEDDEQPAAAPAAPKKKPKGAMAKAGVMKATPKGKAAPTAKLGPEAKKIMKDAPMALMPVIDAAPEVNTLVLSKAERALEFVLDPSEKRILTNPKLDKLSLPMQGPLKAGELSLEAKFKNHDCGNVQKHHMSHAVFEEQYQQFENYGHAENPSNFTLSTKRIVVSTEHDNIKLDGTIRGRDTRFVQRAKRRRKEQNGEPDEEEEESEEEEEEDEDDRLTAEEKKQWGGWADEKSLREKVEKESSDRLQEIARQEEEERTAECEDRETKERITSTFHGKAEKDDIGNSWMKTNVKTKPIEVDGDVKCFLPRKWVHTFSGHTMGVNTMRWFPKTAHMFISAGMDAKIIIWDYHNQRKALRTYTGHDQAVRDVKFTHDGERFYSVSYDKNIQIWDTETGQVIQTLTNKKTPYCIAIHPDPAKQNCFVIGCSNKKAVEFDLNSASIVQEYDEHLGSVNTVTFCEEGRRLLTSSDDKKIFMWEHGIPVVVKHIHEPTMHSIPAMTMSPDEKFLAGQSMDNKIVVYEARGRFKFMGRKTFKGHINSGYAIQPGFSPDMRFLMSGDTDGKLWFWDWHKMKNYRVIKAHDSVLMSCLWHPYSQSRVITAGWDGAIKLWD